ncbi:TetR/AcrR family transcriptional regulator [Psychrobacillus lasiicapitis]|uniref:TetR/AcrR family transcriptional regulator n=1 Tax=Psychrobacillus lasiicapitis TaxID=1636719 RepID=A0A544STU8_9BACI|nr:TetR/AcrR family transcriptional regulator [Psychrobacillus lasiicapitis]TQR08640.1 TetR/AcrR family transcriptional regulator [Psychrobacillus lasiicapitis]GGA45180.1 TetR family transcriptional regulator [Psychrobacillus lasiicapitis]
MSEDEVLLQQLFEEEKLTDKQKKIIIAAIESFSEKGYAATSTNEIAKKAGVAEGTIFRHYKTKKELLVSIVAPLMTKLIGPFIVNDFHKVLDRPYENVEDFLRAAIKNRSDIIKKMLPVIKIVIQEIPFQPELREQFIEQVARKTFERILQVIKDYQDKGQLIEMPTLSVARLAISSIFGFLISRYILFPDSEWDDELETERTVQFIMHGLAVKD